MGPANVNLATINSGSISGVVTNSALLFWWAAAVLLAIVSLTLGYKCLKVAFFAGMVAAYAYGYPHNIVVQLAMFSGLPLIWSLLPAENASAPVYQAYRNYLGRGRFPQEEAKVIQDLVRFYETGQVIVHGEIWCAICDEPVPVGEIVLIVGVIGCKLYVRRIAEPARLTRLKCDSMKRPQKSYWSE